MAKKKCFIYTRTNKHAYEPGQTDQLERLFRYAARKNMEVAAVFSDNVDHEHPQLKGLAELLLTLKTISVSTALLITTPDRLGNDPGNVIGMINFLSNDQCQIHTPTLGPVKWRGHRGLVSIEQDSMEGRR